MRLGLGGEVEESGEAIFASQRVDAEEEALQAVEIGFAFDPTRAAFLRARASCQRFGDSGGVRGGVATAENLEAGFLRSRSFSPCGTIRKCPIEVRVASSSFDNRAGDYQSIAENDSGAWFQDAKALAEEAGAIWNVAEGIVGINGIEYAGFERKAFETSCWRKLA